MNHQLKLKDMKIDELYLKIQQLEKQVDVLKVFFCDMLFVFTLCGTEGKLTDSKSHFLNAPLCMGGYG